MEILVANKKDWTHPSSGGVETHLKETLTRLADRDHEIHFFTSKYPGAKSKEKINGVKIHRYGIPGRTNEMFILGPGQLFFNKLILQKNPDIVYTVGSIMSWIPVFNTESHISSIHHLNGKTLLKQMKFPFNLCGFLAEKISTLMNYGKEIVTVSPQIQEKLAEKPFLDEEKILEVRNGVNTQSFEPEKFSEAEKPTVLYLGRLDYSKGIDLLPEIDRELKKQFGDYKLEIAGKGRKKKSVEKFSSEKEHINLNGYVSAERKKELLSSAWVLIAPSRREGWSLIVLEAAASNTPAVGFKSGGLQSSIKDGKTGKLIDKKPEPEQNISEFAEQTANLLEKDDERKRLGNNAREIAEKMTWEKTTEKLEKIFKRKLENAL